MPVVQSQPGAPRLGTRRQPEASRNAILKAALAEFAQEGLAGARMDAIAEAAGVNKALLYYYFHDKDALYGAVLDEFFGRFLKRLTVVLDHPMSPGEGFLSYVRAHFDTVAESPHHARIFVGEILTAGRSGSIHIERIFAQYMQPIAARVLGVLHEGIKAGEFRAIDPMQFMPSAVGTIVHYFAIAPLIRKFRPVDPFSAEALQQRRAAVLDFAAAALFTDRDAGVKLAAQIATRENTNNSDPHSLAGSQRTKTARRKR
jgi:TetR/AcrR family transcriptional regulator